MGANMCKDEYDHDLLIEVQFFLFRVKLTFMILLLEIGQMIHIS